MTLNSQGNMGSALSNRIIWIMVQLNPTIAHFKGLVKIMLNAEVFFIANI